MPPSETADRHLAAELLDVLLAADPVAASLLGLPGHDGRLGDLGAAAEQECARRLDDIGTRAAALDLAALRESDRQSAQMLAHVGSVQAAVLREGTVEATVTDLSVAPAPALLQQLPQVQLASPERAQGYLDRLRAVPGYLQAAAGRHRDGVASGRVPVAALVRAAVEQLDQVLGDGVADLRLAADDAAAGDDWTARRDDLLERTVAPALRAYRDVLDTEVLPASRDDEHPGLLHLPGGPDTYRVLVRQHTGGSHEPQALHDLGLRLIADLDAELADVGGRAFGTDDSAAVLERLRSDPELAFRDADDMLSVAREAVRRAEAVAPDWFAQVPEQACRVEPVPAAAAPGAPPAYYLPGSLDGTRPGTFFLNTHASEQRRRHPAEAVAFHEAVPGHHFQLTLAQQLSDLPMVRRILVDTAFAEGWGLYCERLADEMGLYSGDVARLGMLAADSWRAARLVVDTGLHALGWSREQAVDWMLAHTPLSRREVTGEVDRYIAMPGQALAYMVGRQEVLALRAETQQRLGDAFDLRDFHDLLLRTGGLPLPVLREVVTRWPGGAGPATVPV